MIDDQTIKQDEGKTKIHLVPPEIVKAIAKVREKGIEKYSDPESWKKVDPLRYFDAAMRHMLEWLIDINNHKLTTDDESGLDHLWHAATNIAFMIELQDKWQKKRNDEYLQMTKPKLFGKQGD